MLVKAKKEEPSIAMLKIRLEEIRAEFKRTGSANAESRFWLMYDTIEKLQRHAISSLSSR